MAAEAARVGQRGIAAANEERDAGGARGGGKRTAANMMLWERQRGQEATGEMELNKPFICLSESSARFTCCILGERS